MRTNIFLILFAFANILNAQIDSKDKVLDAIAIHTCECVNKKDIDLTIKDSAKLELEFGVCIMEGYSKYKAEADKYLNVSFNNENSLEQLGEDVALKMVTHCQDVIVTLAGTYTEEEEEGSSVSIYGEFSRLKKDQFNTVIFKDNDNRNQKLLWLTYFDGAELFDNTDDLKNKKLKVTYYELELFDPKINEYRNFKILQSVSII